MRTRLRGFTLIEILIVLALVGLLSALLFPVFARARDRARIATCASNLRQIGQAIQMYVNDNNRFYPSVIPPLPISQCAWADRIERYAKSPAIFRCPSYPEGEYRSGCPEFDPSGPQYDGSYDLNDLRTTSDFLADRESVHESRFQHPSGTILALDGQGSVVSPGRNTVTDTTYLIGQRVKVRHNGGDNLLFADGHVKWLSLEAMTKQSLWRISGRE